MSGETILIERLRADVEHLRDDRADLQERCNRLSAEKAEALRMLADAESDSRKWRMSFDGQKRYAKAQEDRAEKAERELDEARASYTFMVERAADEKLDGYRELGARAAAAENRADELQRERDEAREDMRFIAETLGVPDGGLPDIIGAIVESDTRVDAAIRRALERAEKAERERDEERHLADVRGEMLTKTERERDARPGISAGDAAALVADYERVTDPVSPAEERALSALRAHAAKVKP